MIKQVDEILHYWFGHIEETGVPSRERSEIWFGGSALVDQEIRDRFKDLLDQAIAGELDEWREHPRSLLALIVLLDQFSRHIFRGTAEAFSQDPKALELCLYGLNQEFDHEVSLIERIFFYLPLMHSEDLEMQASSVHAYKNLSDLSFPETHQTFLQSLDFAVKHYEVIKMFGRFPKRNEALGRKSTPEEESFLKNHKGW